jgi:hypothetical protein
MYPETMERLFGGADKIITDSGASVALSPICRSTSSHVGRKPRLKQEAGDETWYVRLHLAAFLMQSRPCKASGHARIVFGLHSSP